MPRSLHFSDLQLKYNDNSVLNRSEVNSLILYAKQQQIYTNDSLQDTTSNVEFDKSFPVPFWFGAWCSEQIPPHSIFVLKNNSNNQFWPFAVEVTKYVGNAPFTVLLTNGESAFYGNGSTIAGLARVADTLCPILLRFANDLNGDPPVVGKQVGPVDGDFMVSADNTGLLVLAVDIDNFLVKCVPYNEEKSAVVTVFGPAANADCVWPGKIAQHLNHQSHCTDKFPNGSDCVLVVLNSVTGSTGSKTPLKVNEHYIGLKVGEYDDAGTIKPIYTIRTDEAGAGTEIVKVYGGAPNSDCLWPGLIQRHNSGNSHCSNKFTDATGNANCYLIVLNSEGGSAGGTPQQTLTLGTLLVGKLVGSYTEGVPPDETFTPIYAVRPELTQAYAVTITGTSGGGSGPIPPGLSGPVELYPGRTVTAFNWSSNTLQISDKCGCFYEWTDDTWFLIKAGTGGIWGYMVNIISTQAGGSGPLAPYASGLVQLPDGNIVPAINWSRDVTLQVGDAVGCWYDPALSGWFLIRSGGGSGVLGYMVNITDTQAGGSGPLAPYASGLVQLPTGDFVPAINWSRDVTLQVGDAVGCWYDPATQGWFLIRSGGGGESQRTLKGLLNGSLITGSGTANVNTVTTLSGGASGVGAVTATNHLKWSGAGGQVCYIIEEIAAGGAKTYHLTSVEWNVLSRVTNVFVSGLSVQFAKQEMLGKNTNTLADTIIFNTEENTVVLDVVDNVTTLDETRKTVMTITMADDSATTPIFSFMDYALVNDMRVDSDSLDISTRTVRAIAQTDDSTWRDVAALVSSDVVIDVFDNAVALEQTKLSILAFQVAGIPLNFPIIGIENYSVVTTVTADADSLDGVRRTVRAFAHINDSAGFQIATLQDYTVVIDVVATTSELNQDKRTVKGFTHIDDTATTLIADIGDCPPP